MNTMKICSGCQKPLEANVPDGLCPECLLKAGLGTGVDLGPDSQGESGRTSFVAASLEEVARLFPQLEMLGFIGQGGMGAVYKARQKALDRVVALKILPPGIGKDPAFAERFTREAKALARLNHTGIVTLYEFGQADGLFFFLMEFVDGMNLRHLLEVERISAREALAIVPQICDALQYAHDQGIVHRDIKPENILLDRQGRVKVADFGLAKLVGTDALTPALSHPMGEGGGSAPVEGTPASAALTDAGKVMGTPQYMAPEQREHPSEVDHRADIYSLGVVFYQMLTGELPGRPIEAPSHKVQIDVRLDEVVLRALEKEPQRRYQQVSQVKTAVEMISQSPGPASPASRTETSAPRLLKGDAGFVSTPEQLGTFEGQLFLWHRRSQLLLDERQLTISRAGMFTIIPLAAIRDLSIGHYGRVMHPMGLDFISVTYDADGQTQRLFFSPYESWFGLPSNFNRIVFEWFNAIRAAVVAATGSEPGNTPAEQLGVPPGSKALYALLLLPLLMGGIFVIALVRRSTGDAATHSFLGGLWAILAVVGVGFLALVLALIVGRLFGGGPKSRPAGSPRQTSWLPRIAMVGRRGGKAVIHWPGVLLVFMLVLALAEAGAIFASTVLTGAIQSWAVAIALFPAVVFMGMLVRRGQMTPVEKLTSLDGLGGTGPKPARPAPTRGRLRGALMVGVLVWLFVAGTVTLITWIRPESWKVVAVISCPLKLQPGRPVEDHFKHTANMIELIRSDVILGRVIDRLQLDERSGKLDERWGKHKLWLGLPKAQAMVLLKRRLDLRSEGGTLIQVGVFGKRSEEPEEAMDIANTIAEELRAFRIEQHESPADMLEMTLRFTPPNLLLGLGAGFVLGLLAGGLVLWRGFLRRGSQASQVKTAVEQLTPLDGPGGTALKPAGRKWPLPLVGVRSGQRVIHWPGLLLFAVLIVAVAVAVPFTLHVLTPAKGSLGLVVGLVVGFVLLTAKLQQAWTTPIERLPRLDAPERSDVVWPWVLAAVGLVLLIPAVVIVVTRLAREPHQAEVVRQELRVAEQARLAIAQGPSGVWEVRSDGKKAITPLTASGFGPVIERVIATPDADDQGLVVFDMETGKSFKPPSPLTFRPNQGPAFVELTPELRQWIKARDVDVLLHLGEKTWDLMTLEMQEDFGGQLNEWETISPEKVIGIFAKKDAEHLVRDEVAASSFEHNYPDEGSFNAVWPPSSSSGLKMPFKAFRTRSNTMGVYQIQGMGNSNRRGVGIRYKVVLEAVELPAARLRELQLKANEGSLPTTEAETKLKLTQAKMEYLKYLALGAVMFAEKNNGSLPKDLRESFSYPGTDAPPGFLPDLFELVCQGHMSEIKDAAQTIIIREKDPVKTWDGQWMKCYAFADRHVEVHVELAGQFEAWEKARLKSVSRTFSLRHMLASEMGNDLGKILLGRVGMEARPAPDNMQLTVIAPSDVLNRVSTFVAVTDWPKRIAQGKDYDYPREDAEQAGRSFFYACSIEDVEGVTRMLAPRVLAELKGTNLTAQGVGGEEKDEELVRQLRGKWEGKEAAVRRVVQAWNRFPLWKLEVGRIQLSRGFGPRYFASAAFEGAPVERVELSFVPDRSPKTKREPHFGPPGPLMIDTLPPWFADRENKPVELPAARLGQ